MDLSVQLDKRLLASVVVGEVVSVSWFYEALRVRRLFNSGWMITSLLATFTIAILLQMITRKLRPILSVKQAFSTALWLAIFFTLMELSHNTALFTITNVARAAVHGIHKFLLVFSMLFIRVLGNTSGATRRSTSDSSSEDSSSDSSVTATTQTRGPQASMGRGQAMARVARGVPRGAAMARGVRASGAMRAAGVRGLAPRATAMSGPVRGVRPRAGMGQGRPRMRRSMTKDTEMP